MHKANASKQRWCRRLLNIMKSMTAVQIHYIAVTVLVASYVYQLRLRPFKTAAK